MAKCFNCTVIRKASDRRYCPDYNRKCINGIIRTCENCGEEIYPPWYLCNPCYRVKVLGKTR